MAVKALRAKESVLGLNDRQTLSTVTTSAVALQGQGKYAAAETLN